MKLVTRIVLVLVLIALCIGCVVFFSNRQADSAAVSSGMTIYQRICLWMR